MMSEIARLRKQIDQEIEAMRQAQRYAIVAKHEIITHHLAALGSVFEELTEQVGKETALHTILEKLEEAL